jgi:hypothetical protein
MKFGIVELYKAVKPRKFFATLGQKQQFYLDSVYISADMSPRKCITV